MSDSAIPRKLRLPTHVKEFQCAQCAECCTNKWKISVDATSYDKLYQKLAQLGREQELYHTIFHHKNLPHRIRFLPNGKCPYLSNTNLCTIQLDVGAEYMLDICKIYPRRIFASPAGLEISLSLTCKTAVQTLQHGQIRFSEIAWPPDDQANAPFSFLQPNHYCHYSPDTCLSGTKVPYRSLENRFIEILQDSHYSISQRLVWLGQLIKVILVDDKAKTNANAILPDYESLLISTSCTTAEPDWQHHLDQLFFFSNSFLRRFTSLIWPHQLKHLLLALSSDHKQQLSPTATTARAKIAPPHPADYRRKLEQYGQQALSFAEPIIENYLVNYVLGKHFYFEPFHLAYYRLAFAHAAIIAFSIGYCLQADQPASSQITLQSIYDVENIFYSNWFYPRVANFHAGQSRVQIINSGITLANI